MAVHTPGASRSTNATLLKSHINSTLVDTLADGSKRLDVEGVIALFFDEMAAAVAANTNFTNAQQRADYNAAAGSQSFIVPASNTAASVIARSNWETRPDWPLTAESSSKETRVSRVDAYQGEAWTLVKDIIYAYENKVKELPDLIRRWVEDNMLSLEATDESGNRVPGSFPDAERLRDDEIRYYAATYVSDWGEESQMSEPAPVQATGETDPYKVTPYDDRDTLEVSIPAPPTGRNVVATRLYRSSTTETGAAWQFVSEHATGTTPVTIANENLPQEALGEPCVTLTWEEPPADLSNLAALPNGIMAGTSGVSDIMFSEPFAPYAWPAEYSTPLEFPWVGTAVSGQTLFVGTTGNPYLVGGADSASMSAVKLGEPQACVAARGIVAINGGFLYPSPDGLCLVNGSDVSVITRGVYSRATWNAVDPANRFAAFHDGIYYSFHPNPTGNIPPCLAIDVESKRISTLDITVTAAFTDKLTDAMYVASGTSVIGMFLGASARTATWRSARIRLEAPAGFAWLHVLGQHSVSAPATIRAYWDNGSGMTLLHTAVVTSNDPVRFPPGRSGEWEFEVESAARVTRVTFASSVQELNAV